MPEACPALVPVMLPIEPLPSPAVFALKEEPVMPFLLTCVVALPVMTPMPCCASNVEYAMPLP